MHQPGAVRVSEPIEDAERDRNGLLDRDPPAQSGRQPVDATPFTIFACQEEPRPVLAGFPEFDHIRVPELLGRLDLTEETSQRVRIDGDLGQQCFHRHQLVGLPMPGQVNNPLPAPAEFPDSLVAGDRGGRRNPNHCTADAHLVAICQFALADLTAVDKGAVASPEVAYPHFGRIDLENAVMT